MSSCALQLIDVVDECMNSVMQARVQSLSGLRRWREYVDVPSRQVHERLVQ